MKDINVTISLLIGLDNVLIKRIKNTNSDLHMRALSFHCLLEQTISLFYELLQIRVTDFFCFFIQFFVLLMILFDNYFWLLPRPS